jgi:hypothetical protein
MNPINPHSVSYSVSIGDRIRAVSIVLILLCCQMLQAGSLLREVYLDLPGVTLADLTNTPAFLAKPSSTNLITDLFEAPTDVAENYGQRLSAIFTAPISGQYTFWIAGDDYCGLFLSTDATREKRRQIAGVPGWTSPREWGRYPEQQSLPVTLVAGGRYYIEALQKEAGGGDNLSVRWLRPDGVDEGPIPLDHFIAWGLKPEAPRISVQPVPATADEGGVATFTVGFDNPGGAEVLWRRNGQFILQASGPMLRLDSVRWIDSGSLFQAFLTNALGTTQSVAVTLTVNPDLVAPQVQRVFNLGLSNVVIEFSEAVTVPSGPVTESFQMDGGVSVRSASMGASSNRVILEVSGMADSTRYRVSIQGVRDRSSRANPVAAGTEREFFTADLAPVNLGGNDARATTVQWVSRGGFDVSARGGDMAGTTDSAGFAVQSLSGDFDLRVRVESLTITDPYATAGLVVRSSEDANAPFAGAFAGSPTVGSFFRSRQGSGANAVMAAPRGGYPANHPHTWLRLRRSGAALSGFGSMDGTNWTVLGTASISMPVSVQVGLAVSGRDTNMVAVARFRDYGAVTGAAEVAFEPRREGLGLSSRRTRIVFSEIQYRPTPENGSSSLEFVELYNAGEVFEDLSRWKIAGTVRYQFPEGFRLGAGQFVVVARDPAALSVRHGLSGVLGPYTGSFNATGGPLELRDEMDAVKLQMDFGTRHPWPVAANGSGHSLVLSNPSYGEADPRAWSPSAARGGNPGAMDPLPSVDAARNVVFNEVLAHTDLPQLDVVELFNRGPGAADLSGCVLTDDLRTNRFRFPAGTTLAVGAFLQLDEQLLGFRLSAAGETVWLLNADGSRVLDVVRFGAQENGVSFGRSPDGADDWRRLESFTPGGRNAARRLEAVVLNEIMYHPISEDADDEFVEIHNRSGQPVDLSGWRMEDGVSFTFPAGASIAAGGHIVVGRSVERLRSNHPGLNAANSYGDWSGSLRNSGERLALTKPDVILSTNSVGQVTSDTIHIVVSEVSYGDAGRWGQWSDGGGSSMELIDPKADATRASSWADSDESNKGQWQQFSVTDTLRFATQPATRLHLGMLGAGECLIDEVEALNGSSTAVLTNGGFEVGTGTAASGWAFLGHHRRSRVESTGAFAGNRVLRVIAPGDLDAGRNCVRVPLSGNLNDGSVMTLRVRARWVAGWPEILLRTRGGGLELAARLPVPKNLGTPGAPNSRRVPNGGPSIDQVTHRPAVPAAGQPVVVSARVADPDGLSSVSLRFRASETAAFSSVAMRDDGAGGDTLAGDGIWSATLSGRNTGDLLQFVVEAFDNASTTASTLFPSGPVYAGLAPVGGANIRWGDPVPMGSFNHVHAWLTSTQDSLLSNGQDSPLVGGLDNTYRDCTLVHGNLRVIYNAGIRRKGSPFTGQADYALTVPGDDLLLGTRERVFGLTGNGGEEATRMRHQIANWFSRRMGLPYLNTSYIRFYRNGSPYGSVAEDLEQPNNDYAEGWYPEGGEGDLRKVAFAFEFDDSGGFAPTGADLAAFKNPDGQFRSARYRLNWQVRPSGDTANNFSQFFDLVTAANDQTSDYIPNLLNVADIDQWMRSFAFDGCLGNWDTWGTGNSQNKYLYFQPGSRWRILPWDLDWVLGVGDATNRRLFGGNDAVANVMFDTPTFQRMAWRGYQAAVEGPFLAAQYEPQFNARSAALSFNQITGVSSPSAIATYLNGRRTFIINQIQSADARTFAITSNGGANFTSSTAVAVIDGTAPFATATIRVNGTTMPLEWTSLLNFRLRVPLTSRTNVLELVAVRSDGTPMPELSDSVTVRYNGSIQSEADFVGIHEIHYNPVQSGASFVELFNRSTSTSFDLSGCRLNGVDYTFPGGSVIPPAAFWVLVRDKAAFALAYGTGIKIFDEFSGSLDNGGERLSLIRGNGTNEVVISEVRYDNDLPWRLEADGRGSSLQRIDASQSSWRVGNWTAAPTNSADRITPGRANAGAAAIVAFPPLWINEVLPLNTAGPQDNAGNRDPYLEIFNTGDSPIDLAGLYLTDSWTNRTKWLFPQGSVAPPRGFLTVWCDGEVGQSAAGVPHTSFRLSSTNGFVALVRGDGGSSGSTVLDFLSWRSLPADRSLGLVPDGLARNVQINFYPTPGAPNDPSFPDFRVTVNEIMAQNSLTLADPADGHYEDWFELHNGGTNTVDLAGFYLTDRLTNSVTAMFRIPSGYPIPAGGFLRVWADNETGQNRATNADLHVNFALAREGEAVGLFDPKGTMVDGISFGIQTNDVSLGRFPDGGPVPLYAMPSPTPGLPNVLAGGNRPPAFTALAPISAPEQELIQFTAIATDPDAGQTVTYSLGADAPPGAVIDSVTGRFQWLPSEADGPGVYNFLVRASDSGLPSRFGQTFAQVTVREVNMPPVLPTGVSLEAREGIELRARLNASDADRPAQTLRFELEGLAPAGLTLASDGQLTWTPAETLGGTTQTVNYRVTDGGVPALSATGAFLIRVLEMNNVPVFDALPPQKLTEGSAWSATLVARDPEGASVRFRVDGPAPDGFVLDPQTGVAAWTPSESQGPNTVVVLIRAIDGSPEAQSTVRELLLEVAESNEPPNLEVIAPVAVDEGRTVLFTARASDPDQPAQALRFSLEPGAPAGATIDPVSGQFQWTPDEDTGASVQAITVRVSDDGPGNLGATRRVEVTVRPRFKVVFSEILRRSTPTGAEFIEFFNRSARTSWDLSGMRLSGSNLSFTFPPSTTAAPGSRMLVVANRVRTGEVFGLLPGVVGEWSGTLGSVADSLRLIRPATAGGTDEVLDRVDYDSVGPWPSGTQGTNRSLQLIDARQDRNRPGNWAEAVPFQGGRRVIGFTDTWRYFQDGRPTGGTNWVTRDYNDASWASGGGLLYVESAELATNKTTALALGQTTYYFRSKVTIPALTPGVSIRFRVMIDDGYVLWINGRKAHLLGVDDSEIVHDTAANRTVADAAIEGPFTLPTDFLVPGENTFAVEVHQVNAGSSDVVFGLEMTLEGGDASTVTPGSPNNVAAVLPQFPSVWLNEVLPANLSGPQDNAGNRDPYVEIINGGEFPIDIGGLYLTDDWTNRLKWSFPAGSVVPPRGFLTVWCDGEVGQSQPSAPHASFRLNPTNGFVAIVRDEGSGIAATVLDHLSWQAVPPDMAVGWLPDGMVRTERQRLNPTPGAINDPTPPISKTTTLSGRVEYYQTNQGGVRAVTLAMVELPTLSAVTASDGRYTMDAPMTGAISMLPSRLTDSPIAKGVTTADITLIRRHVLGLSALDSPYKVLAGDVNGSDSVTTADISLIRRLILGVATNYPGGSLWRFVPSDESIADPTKPWTASRMRRYASLAGGTLSRQDFKAIKLGDVNGSWQAPVVAGNSSDRAKAKPKGRLAVGSVVASTGEMVALPVRTEGFEAVTSLQFSLKWDPKKLDFMGVDGFQLPGLGTGNFNVQGVQNGFLSLSWDPQTGQGVDLTGLAQLFQLRLKVLAPGGVTAEVAWSDLPTSIEVTIDFEAVASDRVPGVVTVPGGTVVTPELLALKVIGPAVDGRVDLEIRLPLGVSVTLEGSDLMRPWSAVQKIVGQGAQSPIRIVVPSDSPTRAEFWRLKTIEQ